MVQLISEADDVALLFTPLGQSHTEPAGQMKQGVKASQLSSRLQDSIWGKMRATIKLASLLLLQLINLYLSAREWIQNVWSTLWMRLISSRNMNASH